MDTELVLRTAVFAAEKHSNQRRKDSASTPYINHPLGVASYIATIGKVTDPTILQAPLLHDTIEDVGVTYDELVQNFGFEVANIVKEVTDDKSLPKVERKKLQVLNAPHKSYGAKLVKLADKLYNTRDLLNGAPKAWSPEVIHGYFVWTYKVVEGLRGTNSALEAELDKVFSQAIKIDDSLDTALAEYYNLTRLSRA